MYNLQSFYNWYITTPDFVANKANTSFTMFYLTIRLQARVFYEQIVNEAQPSWLSLVENEGE